MDGALASDPQQWQWLGNLYEVLPIHLAIATLVASAIAAGFVVGLERELKHKSAGLRTLALIAAGSCLFTVAGLLLAGPGADPARIAAGVVTGVGFLGAGVIVREGRGVTGLTTGATIWTVAAVGILAGAGYAAAAIALAVVVVTMLVGVGLVEERLRRPCRFVQCHIQYRRDRGKSRVQLLKVLDQFGVPDADWKVTVLEEGDSEDMELRYCHYHGEHRAVLYDLVALPAVKEIVRKRAARDVRGGGLANLSTHSA